MFVAVLLLLIATVTTNLHPRQHVLSVIILATSRTSILSSFLYQDTNYRNHWLVHHCNFAQSLLKGRRSRIFITSKGIKTCSEYLNRRIERNHITFPIHTNITTIHEYFMKRALNQAKRASEIYMEVPIGAIVVRNITRIADVVSSTYGKGSDTSVNKQTTQQVYEILSEEHNRVEMEYDATAHAEIVALRNAAKYIQNWRLSSLSSSSTVSQINGATTILYCTLEPCIMCLSAAQAFRISQIVYGAPDIRLGSCGSYCNLLSIIPTHPYHIISNITSNIYANDSSILLRNFFRQRRIEQQQHILSMKNKSIPDYPRTLKDPSTSTNRFGLWKFLRFRFFFRRP